MGISSKHLLITCLLFQGLSSAVEPPDTGAIKLMTSAQRREIGVDRMTDAEKIALNGFLKDVIQKAYSLGQSKCGTPSGTATVVPHRSPAAYHGSSDGHWIKVNSGGKTITLEDGSLWQINSVDQIDTTLWLPITEISVIRDDQGGGEYKYLLINKEDGEKAQAKYLGKE